MPTLTTYFSAFKKKSGQASGAYYSVKLAGMHLNEIGEFGIIAPNIETLKNAWSKITNHPLNENGIQDVIIFSEEALTSKK